MLILESRRKETNFSKYNKKVFKKGKIVFPTNLFNFEGEMML